jgi:hypothetical protein
MATNGQGTCGEALRPAKIGHLTSFDGMYSQSSDFLFRGCPRPGADSADRSTDRYRGRAAAGRREHPSSPLAEPPGAVGRPLPGVRRPVGVHRHSVRPPGPMAEPRDALPYAAQRGGQVLGPRGRRPVGRHPHEDGDAIADERQRPLGVVGEVPSGECPRRRLRVVRHDRHLVDAARDRTQIRRRRPRRIVPLPGSTARNSGCARSASVICSSATDSSRPRADGMHVIRTVGHRSPPSSPAAIMARHDGGGLRFRQG